MKKNISLAGLGLLAVVGVVGYAGYSVWSQHSASPPESAKKTGISRSSNPTADKPANDESKVGQDGVPMAEYANQRYGFRLLYPAEWTPTLSANGDGVTLSVRDNAKAYVKAYGYIDESGALAEMVASQEAAAKAGHQDLSSAGQKEVLLDNHPAVEAVWTYAALPEDAPLAGPLKRRIFFSRKGSAILVVELAGETSAVDGLAAEFDALIASYALQ